MTVRQDQRLDDILLDRLVDGELSRDEYVAVVRSLENVPEGWRRCALAFLEAQAWQRELGSVRDNAACRDSVSQRALQQSSVPLNPAAERNTIGRSTASGQRDTANRWLLLLATAASFLVAFGLGIAFRSTRSDSRSSQVASPLAERDGSVESAAEKRTPEQSVASKAFASAGSRVPAEAVTVVVDHGDAAGARETPIPVYDWSPEGERWLSSGPSAPALEMERMLGRLGRGIQVHRHFIPANTHDGRDVLIPVEQMEITPVARRAYQ